MRGENINFRLKDLRMACDKFSTAKGEKVSTTLIKAQMNSSFFANSKRNYMVDTGDMSGEFGRSKADFYYKICRCFELDPLKYMIIEGAEEEPEEAVEEPKQNEELVEILKAINSNLEMLGRICVQNHIDIMELKDFWK